MIVVSGCPRSGTSLMMLCLREALGEERIIGSKWPMDKKLGSKEKQACIDYLRRKKNPDYEKNLAETKKMNPCGFWECGWTVKGIQYTEPTPDPDKVVKLVSQGLAQSNPAYVGKVIMMLRHPWSVAKSQQDLLLPMPIHTRNKDLGTISAEMFLSVTVMASRWLHKHKPEMILVEFEELVTNPDAELQRVKNFLGKGEWHKAREVIQPKLKRNEPTRPNEDKEWDDALNVYWLFKEGKYEQIIEWAEAREVQKSTSFYCPRFGGNVNDTICTQCKGGEITDKLRQQAVRRKIEYWNEPCLWECGMNPQDTTPLTIEGSIQKNHWGTEAVEFPDCEGCKRNRGK